MDNSVSWITEFPNRQILSECHPVQVVREGVSKPFVFVAAESAGVKQDHVAFIAA